MGKAARLLAGHLVWYLGARVAFPWLEQATGVCRASHLLTRRACYKGGSIWTGFDTSGHCFLLTFNNLFISEETVESKRVKVDKKDGEGDSSQEEVEPPLALSRYILCLLMLVWDLMILCTSLYFRSFLEKVFGAISGVGAWYLLYKVLFPFIRQRRIIYIA